SLGDISVVDTVQSIGGGGGNGRLEFVVNTEATADVSAGLGGSQSTNADGGAISFERDGTVYSVGKRSIGSSIQSIGGGGGTVDLAVQTVATGVVPAAADDAAEGAVVKAADSPAPGERIAALSIGAAGGSSNDGGKVELQFAGAQATAGERSPAVVVQSVGAGGGTTLVTGMNRLSVALGGTAGSQGDGGAITLTNTGAIQTTGALAHGVLLQSIGGGGGAVFTDTPASAIQVTLNRDNSGNGGAISFRQAGDIVVTGDRAIALAAQSLGGGGGMVDRIFADTAGGAGRAGAVTLDIDGNVAATGTAGVGIFAQSSGRDGQGDINVTLTEGKAIIGGAGGAAVWLSGGANNHVISHGLVTTRDGIAGTTIRGTSGNDWFDNYGTFYGQFALGSGNDRFVNHAGALFVPGAALELGNEANVLVNSGTLQLGGPGKAQRIDLVGSFQQTATGVTQADIDFGTGQTDEIVATGTVDLAGRIEISLLNPQLISGGKFSKTLFAGAEGATNNGVKFTAPESAVITYALGNATGKGITLDFTVDFCPEGLSPNLESVGDYLNGVQSAGSSPEMAGTVTKLVAIPQDVPLAVALSQLTPDFYGEHQAVLVRNSQQFGETLLSRQPDEKEIAGGKGRSVWFQEEVGSGSHSAHGDFKEFNCSSTQSSVGLQKVNGHWTAGVGVAIENGKADGYAGHWSAKEKTEQVGFSLKRQTGETTLAASVAYGWNEAKVHRLINVTSPYETSDTRYLEVASGLLRGSHDYTRVTRDGGKVYLRPSLDLGVTRLVAKVAHESGAGAQNLTLPSGTETHSWITPRVEAGLERTYKSGLRLRPYVTLGWQHYLNHPETQVRAGLEGAPDGVEEMIVPIELGQNSIHAEVGCDLISQKGLTVRLGYRNISASHIRVDSGNIKATIPF
ncbi:MAG TPA: autotransporter outer membrane beta-barrel domain-containing protein, partial [Opitutaceae bacterium]|nr:autotransporter outer membrane beta-barrel domain-containing protein [Opitutaceae bacterium]